MVKFSRYILVVIAIFSLAIALPRLYWISFEKPIKAPSVFYSCVDNDFFMIRPADGGILTNSNGDEFTRDEFELKLPLNYSRQLTLNRTMPDSINGVEMDLHEISRNRSFFRVRPKDIDTPLPSLYPLFESQSGRANLEMPDDFFRITWRMEFLDSKTNKILEEKSRMFSAVLYNRGFKFPATSINGLPTTRKSCDEGYLVIDGANQLFHIKMIKGKPFVRKVDLPEGLKFKHIACVDFSDKLYYAYLFSTNHEVYVLTQYDYMLQKLDVAETHPELNEVRILGDLFNYTITSLGNGFISTTVLDKDFKFVDTYKESWLTKDERLEGKIAHLLFPFELKLTDNKSSYIRFFSAFHSSFLWLIVSLCLMVLHFIIIKKRKENVKNQIADLAIIAITGIFGFIAVNFFPNKFFM
ncbi:DUF4857 domain-containing protein [Draconibacterium sp. IB214405]|uniref:DUF4857 domain-containing protein n=1 Tax=Draconibacterium sp. IB214405 TaxID=3097352 RepID=UPI002A0C002A|nr:DUF4857 domain-containing protein [Draconibacterium sp. IB214405]MDX8340008.1 DUF4857 domain-containing protein [Draconibacterium sp. IB214405]